MGLAYPGNLSLTGYMSECLTFSQPAGPGAAGQAGVPSYPKHILRARRLYDHLSLERRKKRRELSDGVASETIGEEKCIFNYLIYIYINIDIIYI